MQQRDFLFEIGVEEIPTGYIRNAIVKMAEHFRQGLSSARLSFSEIEEFSTPRRFAIRLKDLPLRQPDDTREKIGPALSLAYDEQGNLTKAAQGFLRGCAADKDRIYTVETEKGPKIAVSMFNKGLDTIEILSSLIKGSFSVINFPKMMKWGNTQMQFARPVRWLVALFGDEVIELEINGLKTGRITYGNRFLGPGNHDSIDKPSSYVTVLKALEVIPERNFRRELVRERVNLLLQDQELEVVEDEALLDEVVDLIENPVAALAAFDQKYLRLPEKIVTSTLSQHQRYFAVKKRDGKLASRFVFISNGDPEFIDLIRAGNEKVVRARLEDAEFYYLEDTGNPLESYVEKLREVTFQEQLGSLYEKTDRITEIVKYLCRELHTDRETTANSLRAARLCKADLVTLMLGEKEFTKLQGYIGMNYALSCGEKEEVARAIYEHYLPRGQNDDLPAGITGAILAIADKLDTVCGIIGVGMIPTGSNDPFALRRAANGIVQIIARHGFILDLLELIRTALEILCSKLGENEKTYRFLVEYFHQRVSWLLKESEIDYDVIDSVMHIDYSDIVDLKHRAQDLQEFKQRDDFIKLVIGFKRVSNIIVGVKDLGPIDPGLLIEKAEKELYSGSNALLASTATLLEKKEYHKIMEELVRFGPVIDNFFDRVLVNTDDNRLRINRYNLLAGIRSVFLRIADIAKIVVEGQ